MGLRLKSRSYPVAPLKQKILGSKAIFCLMLWVYNNVIYGLDCILCQCQVRMLAGHVLSAGLNEPGYLYG